MAEYSYYPGCTLKSTATEYELSVKAVFGKLGHTLHEIDGWICCGASPTHQTNANLSGNLAAYNIMLASKEGRDIIAPCAACFNRLKHGLHKLNDDPEFSKSIEKELGFEYRPVRVLSPLEVIAQDDSLQNISRNKTFDLGLKVVPYYGCLLVRPPKVMQFDDAEDPRMMNAALEAAGIEVLSWEYKTECCGGSLSFGSIDSVLRLTQRILSAARKAGADAIAVACPLCEQNLDVRQFQINKKYSERFDIPVFYFTELIAIALGAEPKSVGVDKHVVDAVGVLKKER